LRLSPAELNPFPPLLFPHGFFFQKRPRIVVLRPIGFSFRREENETRGQPPPAGTESEGESQAGGCRIGFGCPGPGPADAGARTRFCAGAGPERAATTTAGCAADFRADFLSASRAHG